MKSAFFVTMATFGMVRFFLLLGSLQASAEWVDHATSPVVLLTLCKLLAPAKQCGMLVLDAGNESAEERDTDTTILIGDPLGDPELATHIKRNLFHA